VWAASDLIKGLWLLRRLSKAEPRVWWDHQELVVFSATAPAELDPDTLWQLAELRWVHVESHDKFGESYWRLGTSGG
jgi:hypothetical protein